MQSSELLPQVTQAYRIAGLPNITGVFSGVDNEGASINRPEGVFVFANRPFTPCIYTLSPRDGFGNDNAQILWFNHKICGMNNPYV